MISFIVANWWQILLTALAGYLLGSINFAVIITKKVMKNADIRQMGSGNAGFTNVLRSVGKGPAVFTIVFDFIKGILAVSIGWMLFSTVTGNSGVLLDEYTTYGKYIAGFFCILGHMFPVYFNFKGGKGVVTAAALILVQDWRVFLLVIATFLILFLITKIVSASVLVCGALYGIYTFLIAYFVDYLPNLDNTIPYTFTYVIAVTACSVGIGALVVIKHKDNIKRLMKGEEKKLTAKKKS